MILKMKYAGERIGEMNDAKRSAWGMSLLLKIHVITGWVIPDGDLMKVLVDQFQKKLQESYPDTCVEEIEYAFRQHGTGVKDWGKAMNLALIDEVMIPYLGQREVLSREYEEREANLEQKIYTDEQLQDLHRQDVEQFYQRLLSGWIPDKFPQYFSSILEKDGLKVPGQSTEQFFTDRLNKQFKNIYIRED